MNKNSPLFIVGLGPGKSDLLPPRAFLALQDSEVIAGYTKYIELISPDLLDGKTIISTGMMGEVKRCKEALDAAKGGKITSVVSSGDAGIYALASLIYEIVAMNPCYSEIDIQVIPGIPALCASAALLGAPLTHDFACISLSDLLTPWELIKKRITSALDGDFVLCIYNPRSKKRDWQLQWLIDEAIKLKGEHTVAGLVHAADRDDQIVSLHTVSSFPVEDVDMFSLVVIGNSSSTILPSKNGSYRWVDGARMVTPRGYYDKYDLRVKID